MYESLLKHFQGKQRYVISEEFMYGMLCLGNHRREWYIGFVNIVYGEPFVHVIAVSSARIYIRPFITSLSLGEAGKVLPLGMKKFSSIAIGTELFHRDNFIGMPLVKKADEKVEYYTDYLPLMKTQDENWVNYADKIPAIHPGRADQFLTEDNYPLMLLADEYVYVPVIIES